MTGAPTGMGSTANDYKAVISKVGPLWAADVWGHVRSGTLLWNVLFTPHFCRENGLLRQTTLPC